MSKSESGQIPDIEEIARVHGILIPTAQERQEMKATIAEMSRLTKPQEFPFLPKRLEEILNDSNYLNGRSN